jgi:hypothetical protein
VFAANDQMALGVLRAFHVHGRTVPGDINIVGFDDVLDSEYFIPPLTTVHQDSTSGQSPGSRQPQCSAALATESAMRTEASSTHPL